MSDIPALHNFVPGQPILDTEVEADFETIRTYFNTYAVQTDTVKTVTVTHLVSAATPFRFTGTGWTDGDLIYLGSGNGSLTRLAKGTAGQVLRMNSGATAPEWSLPAYWLGPFIKNDIVGSAGPSTHSTYAGAYADPLGPLFHYIAQGSGSGGSANPVHTPGSITALFIRATLPRTAGTATFEVYKNNVATGLTVVLNGTDTQVKVTTQAVGLDTVVLGDEIEVKVTTASYTPTGATQSFWAQVQITPT